MPEVGDIVSASSLGRTGHKYMWHSCIDCGRPRWVMIKHGKPENLRCKHCAHTGVLNLNWKGGINSNGYKVVHLGKDDFFYPMTMTEGAVLEHRLVMAKSLGRCLQTSEIVHHKNHVRSDNQLDNLQLISGDKHWQITLLENKIEKLIKENKELKRELQQLKEN